MLNHSCCNNVYKVNIGNTVVIFASKVGLHGLQAVVNTAVVNTVVIFASKVGLHGLLAVVYGYIITWMLHHIFAYSDKIFRPADLYKDTSHPPLLLLEQRTNQ